MTHPTTHTRLARCGCGALTAATRGESLQTYLCSCRVCQTMSGAAFSYAAIFKDGDVTIAGARTTWRKFGDSGRWIDLSFCPICGASVFFRGEGLPGLIGVNAGCFDDAAGLNPQRMYWASRKHEWVSVPDGVELVERQ